MLKLRCIQRSSHCLGKEARFIPARFQHRTISATQHHNARIPLGSNTCSLSGPPTLQLSRPCPIRWLGHNSLRFASTDIRSTPIADIQPTFSAPSPPPSNLPSSTNEVIPDPSSLDSFPSTLEGVLNDQPHVNEYIGYLKDMGLDYGWGPSSTVQFILEHIHVYTGYPWWACIALTVFTVRVAIFKFYVNAQDTSARMAAIKPLSAPIEKRMKEAMKASEQEKMMRANQEKKALHARMGIKSRNLWLPIALQVPLGFGTFRLLRGMSALPVPGFDTGGVLWFTDLTIPDPYFILPVLTGVSFYYTFKMGSETGSTAANMSPSTYKVFAYLLPVVSGFFAIWWPAGLQIPILMSSLFAATQSLLFKQPWFRRLWRIQLRGVIHTTPKFKLNRGTIDAKPQSKGMFGDVKTAYSDMVSKGKEAAGTSDKVNLRQTKEDIKKAKAYEAEKARATAQRKFEAAQAKMAAKEEERRRRGMQA